jgi:hypothetical protein
MKRRSNLLNLVDIEFGEVEEEVAEAALIERGFQLMASQEGLEPASVGDLAEIDGAEVFEHGLHELHYAVHEGAFVVESQQEVDAAANCQLA